MSEEEIVDVLDLCIESIALVQKRFARSPSAKLAFDNWLYLDYY